MKTIQLFVGILFFFFISLIGNCSETKFEGGDIKGVFREEKGDSEYERFKKENLFMFYERENEIFGKQIGLDYPVEGERIRGCGYCSDTYQMILGYDLIRHLSKENNNSYKGKMYDIYNRKWFDVRISFIDSDTINIRLFAYFSLFGKNIRWKRDNQTLKNILISDTVSISDLKNNELYAIGAGELKGGKIDYNSFLEGNEITGKKFPPLENAKSITVRLE